MCYYQAIIVPTIILNTDNTIYEITRTYTSSEGSGAIDPKTLISGFDITIENEADHLYDNSSSMLDQTDHVLTDQTIPWSNATRIETSYNDIFGNSVAIDFIKS